VSTHESSRTTRPFISPLAAPASPLPSPSPTSRLTARLVHGTPCAFGTSRPLRRPRLVCIVVGSSHYCGTDSGRVGSRTVEFAASNQREGSWCPRWQWRSKQGDVPAACCAALMPASGTNLRTEKNQSPRCRCQDAHEVFDKNTHHLFVIFFFCCSAKHQMRQKLRRVKKCVHNQQKASN
jgi:hypothetical protein